MSGHEHMGGAGGPKSLDMKTLKRLLNYFGAYKPMLWVVVVLVLVSAIASAASLAHPDSTTISRR